MRKRSPVGVYEARGYWPWRFSSSRPKNFPHQFAFAKTQGRRSLITQCLGITAACLAAGLIAFNAIVTFDADRALLPTPLDMAEPRELVLNAAPAPGHFHHKGPGDDRNVRARARPAHPGPLSQASGLAGRFLS